MPQLQRWSIQFVEYIRCIAANASWVRLSINHILVGRHTFGQAVAVRSAERVVQKITREHEDCLEGRIGAPVKAVQANNRHQATTLAHDLKGEAGTFGWPLMSVAAGGLRQLLESEFGRCLSEPVDIHLESLQLPVNEDMRGECPEGQKLVRNPAPIRENHRVTMES